MALAKGGVIIHDTEKCGVAEDGKLERGKIAPASGKGCCQNRGSYYAGGEEGKWVAKTGGQEGPCTRDKKG